MNLNNVLTLNEKVLLAAFELQGEDLKERFTAEDLLVQAWKQDNGAFGLRNYERDYPDSNKLYTKLDGKDGLVRKGLLKRVADRTYTLTAAGLSMAISLKPASKETQLKVDRSLYDELKKIINHKVFGEWLVDSEKPKKFRDAGWFWGIAPGNPPEIVQERLSNIEQNLKESRKRALEEGGKIVIDTRDFDKDVRDILIKKGNSSFDEHKSKIYLDLKDIDKCIDFNETLRKRFQKELKIMLGIK